MRKFGFTFAVCPMNAFLSHNEIGVKYKSGTAEHLTKAKFIRTLENDIVGNVT